VEDDKQSATDSLEGFACAGLWIKGFLGFSAEEGILHYANGEVSFHAQGYELFRFPASDVKRVRFTALQYMILKTPHGSYTIQPQPDKLVNNAIIIAAAGILSRNAALQTAGGLLYGRRKASYEKTVLLPIVQTWAEIFIRAGAKAKLPKANHWKIVAFSIVGAIIITGILFWLMVILPMQHDKEAIQSAKSASTITDAVFSSKDDTI
jgi:hypothetical protein